MRLTKKQVDIIDAMQSGGWIWTSGSRATYLARCDGSGRVQSEFLHAKTFSSLLESGAIVKGEGNRYVLKDEADESHLD